MEDDIAIALSQLLHDSFSHFHGITGQVLSRVRYSALVNSPETIVFDFEQSSLVVEANPDDDSVEFRVCSAVMMRDTTAVEASHLQPWRSVIGQPFGWGWITINQQGYCDGLLLSFTDIEPRFCSRSPRRL